MSMPIRPEKAPLGVGVEGRAVIEGKPVTREAVAAENMMQAFAYWHLVPTNEGLRVSVVPRGAFRIPARIVGAQPVMVPAGGTARVRVTLPPGVLTFEKIQFELSDPPDGISLRDLTLSGPGGEFIVQAEGGRMKAGFRGNLIVTVSGERVPPPTAPAGAVRRRVQVLTLPAIPIEIVPTGK